MAQKIPLLRAAVIVYRSKPSSARWIAKKKQRWAPLLARSGHNALGKSNNCYAPTVLRDQNSPSCLLDFVLLDAFGWRLREPCWWPTRAVSRLFTWRW